MWKPLRVSDADSLTSDAALAYVTTLPKAAITALQIRIHGTGGAGAVALTYAMVTKVKITTDKGDKKPLELSATQLVRRAGIMEGIPPATTSGAGAYSDIPFPVYFGTKAADRRFLLNLRDCNKRELELTFDATLVAATRFAAGAVRVSIIAICWVGDLPPEYCGHIRQEEALNLATGTGDTQPQSTMPNHPGGKLAFMDFTVSAVTTVEDIVLTGNSDSILLITEHFRDIMQRMNVERHLDTALTLTAYYDFMFEDRYASQIDALPSLDQMTSWKLVVERGATTTTLVVVQGTILP